MKIIAPALLLCFALNPLLAAEKSVEDRLSDLEMKSDLNPITIKGQVIIRHDAITRNMNRGTAAAPQYEDVKFNLNRIRFYLDFNGDLSPRVSFYSRIAASKQQNEVIPATSSNVDAINQDQNGRAFRGADLYLERAYLNFRIIDNLVLSAGRLSIIDGPPYNLTWGESPLGTYPFLSYQNNFDGYALSYALGDFTLRAVYHPFSQVSRDTNSTATPAFGNNSRQLGIGDAKAFNVDYNSSTFSFARNVSGMAQYLFGDNIQLPDQKLPPPLPTAGTYGTSDLSFDLKVTTLYLGLDGIAKTGINIGLSYATSVVDTRGTLYNELVPLGKYIGVLSDLPKETVKGHASLAIVSYDISSKTFLDPTVGVEIFSASERFFFSNANPLDPFRMYGVHGSAQHIFYVQPLDDVLKLRIGFITTKPKYSSGSLFGAPAKLEGDAAGGDKSMYAELKLSI